MVDQLPLFNDFEIGQDAVSMFGYFVEEESKMDDFSQYTQPPVGQPLGYDLDERMSTALNFKLEVSAPKENEKKRKIPYENYYFSHSGEVEYESKAEEPAVEIPRVQADIARAESRRAALKQRSKSFDGANQPKKASPVTGRRNKRPRSNSESEIRTRAPLWTDQEEIFLVGAVMRRFFKYGSLASSRKTENDVWDSIKLSFDQMVRDHGRVDQAVRSKNALSRHFKFMKSTQNPERPKFYELYKKYEERYGKGSMFEGL